MSYDYRVRRVLRVVDGDTVDLELDLGFHLTTALRFRLLGVDTPERGQPGYLEAKDYVARWLADALARPDLLEVRARTAKADSFGRWLVALVAVEHDGHEVADLSAELLEAGLAKPYTGRTS